MIAIAYPLFWFGTLLEALRVRVDGLAARALAWAEKRLKERGT